MEGTAAGGPLKRILVVEDNPVTLRVYEMTLKTGGYEVLTAKDASTAVRIAQTEPVDLITMDVNLEDDLFGPGWDGLKVVEWLKRIVPQRRLPVIVISALDASQLLDRAAELGVYSVLTKPVRKEQLLAIVAEALAAHA